jgi:hypothetical protein
MPFPGSKKLIRGKDTTLRDGYEAISEQFKCLNHEQKPFYRSNYIFKTYFFLFIRADIILHNGR